MKTKKIFAFLVVATSLVFPGLVWAAEKGGEGWSIDSVSEYGLPKGTVFSIIENVLLWLLAILGIVGVIGFVISGIMYLTAAGDDKKMETAKNAMKYSIIGIIVGLSGLVAIQAVNTALGGSGIF
ncbi:MAG TPA: hypothetical protein PLK35_02460 [Candidatus Moranbacteria bacterium]|nr:hypothetical protein [Candidatus Moranbacteria bacterium]